MKMLVPLVLGLAVDIVFTSYQTFYVFLMVAESGYFTQIPERIALLEMQCNVKTTQSETQIITPPFENTLLASSSISNLLLYYCLVH